MVHVAEAASVLLARGRNSPEVYLVRRSEQLRFFGGFWAFPGGKVDPADASLPVTAGNDDLNPRRAAAARELFEETGVLLARRADGSYPAAAELASLRDEHAANRITFADVLACLGASLHTDDFALIGHVTTPAFQPIRFDTTFFVSVLPPEQEPHIIPGELDRGEWASAADMLDRWRRGHALVSPPTVMTLGAVEGRAVEEAPACLGSLLRRIDAGAIHPIYFAPDVQLIPLSTPNLPLSRHVNAYLVGRDPAYLIDPGTDDDAERRRLFDLLDERIADGARLAAVVLTHEHPDHIGSAAACSQRYGVPVWGHVLTADLLRGQIDFARLLNDRDRLDLGRSGDGESWSLETVLTPGHAPGHLAFYEPHYRLLFAADMISTLSSVVVPPPPHGDMAVYLASLRRLQGYDCRLLLPSHGNPTPRPQEAIAKALEHRARRERELLEALADGPQSAAELTARLYRDVAEPLARFARLQTLAGLLKLENEGKVRAAAEAGPEAGPAEQRRYFLASSQ